MSTLDNTIVVGIDGSDASYGAVQWAAKTASGRRSRLLLLSTYSVPVAMFTEGMVPPQSLYADLERELRPVADRAAAIARTVAPELMIDDAIVEGNPTQVLIEYSREAKMIVLGSRGLEGIKGMVLGSVSAGVASHAFSPVVVTREDTIDPASNGPVVVGIDGSPISDKATEWAFSEASARNTSLVAVHAWADPQIHAAAAGITLSDDDWVQLEQAQQQELAERLAGYGTSHPDVSVKRVCTRDRAVRALVELSQDAQLLVAGSHGRGGFTGMLLGSTSRALLQAAPCPVMVVRPECHD